MSYHNGMLTSLPQSIYPDSWVSGKSVVIMTSHWPSLSPGLTSFLLFPIPFSSLAATQRQATKTSPTSQKACFWPKTAVSKLHNLLLGPSLFHAVRESKHHSRHTGGFYNHLEAWACVQPFHLIRTVPGIKWAHKYLWISGNLFFFLSLF